MLTTYLCEHLRLSKSLDVADSTGCASLELDSLQALVHVQRVVTARGLHLCLLSVLTHSLSFINN